MKFILFLTLIAVVIYGEDFYPLSVGNYWEYKAFIVNDSSDTIEYSQYIDLTGDTIINGNTFYLETIKYEYTPESNLENVTQKNFVADYDSDSVYRVMNSNFDNPMLIGYHIIPVTLPVKDVNEITVAEKKYSNCKGLFMGGTDSIIFVPNVGNVLIVKKDEKMIARIELVDYKIGNNAISQNPNFVTKINKIFSVDKKDERIVFDKINSGNMSISVISLNGKSVFKRDYLNSPKSIKLSSFGIATGNYILQVSCMNFIQVEPFRYTNR